MSRDMTLYVDDDGSAYHMYSARETFDGQSTYIQSVQGWKAALIADR